MQIEEKQAGICFADISTGEIHVTEIAGGDLEAKIINELARFSPSEIITGQIQLKKKELTEYIISIGGTEKYRVVKGRKETTDWEGLAKRLGATPEDIMQVTKSKETAPFLRRKSKREK